MTPAAGTSHPDLRPIDHRGLRLSALNRNSPDSDGACACSLFSGFALTSAKLQVFSTLLELDVDLPKKPRIEAQTSVPDVTKTFADKTAQQLSAHSDTFMH